MTTINTAQTRTSVCRICGTVSRLWPRCLRWNKSIPWSKRIADLNAVALRVIRAEFLVVVNEIGVRLGRNEDTGDDVEAQRSADMSQKVVIADKIATGEEAATGERLIEADALAPNPGQQFRLNYFAESWSVEEVEVIQDRPVRLKSLVEVLACAPRDLSLESDTVLEGEIAAKVQVGSTTKRLSRVICGCARGRRRSNGADSKRSIDLLRVGGA